MPASMKVEWCKDEPEVYRRIAGELSRHLAENEGVPFLILTAGAAADRLLPLLQLPAGGNVAFGALSTEVRSAQVSPDSLGAWRRANPEGFVASVMEVRADGGVMGIAPFPENPELFRSRFDAEGKWAAPQLGALPRANAGPLTATFSFLREAVDATIAYAVAGNRGKALRRLFAAEGFLYETPARILLELEYATLFSLPLPADSFSYEATATPYAF